MLFDSDRLDNIVGRVTKNEIVSLSIKKMGGGFDSVSAKRENFYTQRNRSGGEKRMDFGENASSPVPLSLNTNLSPLVIFGAYFFSLCIQGWARSDLEIRKSPFFFS